MSSCSLSDPRKTSLLQWILRIVVLVHALGLASQYLFSDLETDSPIWSVLYYDLSFPEETATLVDNLGNFFYLCFAVCVIVVPLTHMRPGMDCHCPAVSNFQILLLSTMTCWAFLLAAAKSSRYLGEYPEALTIGSQAARYLAPAALIALLFAKENLALWLLRVGTASTFCFHGIAALMLKGSFVDLLINSSQNLLGYDLPQSTATSLLYLIGAIDLVIALILLIEKSRFAAGYMACWGLITAASRITAGGIEQYPELLIRAAHYGAPLVVFVRWMQEASSCEADDANQSNLESKSSELSTFSEPQNEPTDNSAKELNSSETLA